MFYSQDLKELVRLATIGTAMENSRVVRENASLTSQNQSKECTHVIANSEGAYCILKLTFGCMLNLH